MGWQGSLMFYETVAAGTSHSDLRVGVDYSDYDKCCYCQNHGQPLERLIDCEHCNLSITVAVL